MLTAKQLREAPPLAREEIHVPEWAVGEDDLVTIQVMSGLAMSAYQARLQALSKDGGDALSRQIMLEYVAASIIDPDSGELVFDDPESMEILGRKNGKGLQRIFQTASKLNRDDEGSAADFLKPSGTAPASETGGNTPSTSDSPIPT